MMASDDPFVAAQAEIESALQQTQALEASYIRIRSISASSDSPELHEARSELEHALTDVAADLQDLIESVQAAEKDPFQYGLDVDEVAQRRRLVQRAGREIERMRQEVKQTAQKSAYIQQHEAYHGADDEEEDIEYEQQRQVEILHEQDEQLDDVFRTVGNLRVQADTMGRELEEQAEIIGDADRIADRVGGKLQQGMKRVGSVLKANEGKFWRREVMGLTV